MGGRGREGGDGEVEWSGDVFAYLDGSHVWWEIWSNGDSEEEDMRGMSEEGVPTFQEASVNFQHF